MQLSIPLPRTPDGRVYRFSPNEKAHPRHFLLGAADESFIFNEAAKARMKLAPGSSQTVCPYSGIVADDDDFTHPDDVEAAVEIVRHAAVADVTAELRRTLGGLNRSQPRNSPVRITASVEPVANPKPRFARRDLLRELICDHCGRDYGVYAISLFCPDCGAPNLRLHFAREVELVRTQVKLAESQNPDQQELAYRLLGNAHEDVLTAFEATLKIAYLYGVANLGPGAAPAKPPRNDFQNVDNAQQRFAECNLKPFEDLDADQLATLRLNIQKRHIIGHNLGVMDEKFAEYAETARVGETVHLVGEDILLFANVSQLVVDYLDTWLGGSPAPTTVADQKLSENNDGQDGLPAVGAVMKEGMDELGLELSPLAQRVGRFLAEQSNEGMTMPLMGDRIMAAFSDESPDSLDEAVAELELDGFITTFASGARLPAVRPTLELYTVFDPLVHGTDPSADAVALAKKVLEGDDAVNIAELHASTAWPLRRFNPSIALVVEQINDRRVSKTMDATYPTRFFHMLAADRVSLRRFVAQSEA